MFRLHSEFCIEMSKKTFIVPSGCAEARAYFCTPVDDSVAERSSVLTSLLDVEGIVELPGVEMLDVKKWEELLPEQVAELTLEQLSHALTVCPISHVQ